MSRQTGNSTYALIGVAAVVVVGALVGALYWDTPVTGKDSSAQSKVTAVSAQPDKTLEKPAEKTAGVAPSVKDAGSASPVRTAENTKEPVKDSSTAAGTEGQKQVVAQTGSEVSAQKPDSGKTDTPKSADNSAQGAEQKASEPVAPQQATGSSDNTVAATVSSVAKSSEASQKPQPLTADGKPGSPTFDHVRIEPNGENVLAGRVTPGATIEMIRDGEVYARTVADPSGLFALVAPALPAGASHIYLQSIAPDGKRETSKESLTVMISKDKTRRPLVALASPDKPTVVLSNPDSPDGRNPEQGGSEQAGKPGGAVRPDVQVATIEARESGRLFVSGKAAPGATIRLYLNGTLVAPGGADSEGKFSFTIARGMVPGDYRIRLDDVDPVSSQVRSRSEVLFRLPGAGDMAMANEGANLAAASGQRVAGQSDVVVPSIETATVHRGDSLWRISQKHYGTGYLYLEIYDANLRKIQNPNLIYPGQVLVLPQLEKYDSQ